ncbi:G- coupled receptor 98-like, partial [Paramuricea clavata]
CCNLWRILVLNDEHTDRKYILYFMLGWGIPVLCIALYMIITHALYSWGITEIYADVHNNGDMCFIPNAYGALASVLGPVLLFLLAVGVVMTQAYQVSLQWKLYDDIFRGHHNIKEVMHLWIVFFAVTMTWLFGGLHLAFGKLWLAIFFAIFDVFTGLYVFMVYFVLRNQCRRKYRDEAYLLHTSSPSLHNPSPTDYYAERPVMYDAQSVNSLPKSELRLSPPEGNEWDDFEYDGATPKGSRRGFDDIPLAQINPLYDVYHGKKPGEETNDDVIEKEEEELSEDLNDLVRALKTGETLPEEDDGTDNMVELKPEAMRTDKLELRRVSIADTHV